MTVCKHCGKNPQSQPWDQCIHCGKDQYQPKEPPVTLDRAVALMNRGLMWNQQGRFEMGAPLLKLAHEMAPTCRECGVAYAESLLRQGDFKLGFYLHNHYRLSRSWIQLSRHFPEWQGEQLRGKHILVVEEGGTGDCIMMLRYISLLERAGAKVTLALRPDIQPLVRQQSWYSGDGGTGAPDYWISLMSLPLHFGIVWEGPYLRPSISQSDLSGIGFCHKAGAVLDGGNFRSLTGTQRDRIGHYLGDRDGFDLTNDDGKYLNWDITASVISGLDLVITVDTGVMHLSAAMGKPTWVLLGAWSDWKFGLTGDTMAWYPTVRLFRGGRGGFDAAIDALIISLDKHPRVHSTVSA